jgi:hypothetical protein
MSPQRTVTGRRESERRFERTSKVRLVSESSLASHLYQWALKVHPLPRELKTAHEQITVRTCPEHAFELAGQVIPRQSRDGF